ncbi:MAG: hypothetical protein WEB13_05150 [Dehalococcoidia bacterium]
MVRARSVLTAAIVLCAVLLVTTAPSASHSRVLFAPSVTAIDGPTGDAIALDDWSASSTVTVEVLSGPGGSALMPAMSVLTGAGGNAIISVPVSFAAGQLVRASLALVTKEVIVTTLTAQADATADVVSGAAPATTVVSVEVCNLAICVAAPPATADPAGSFIVSVGSLAPPAANIRVGSTFSATISDADGDGQRVEGAVSPTVSAILGVSGGTIVLNGWAGFPATQVTIDRLTGPGGTSLGTFMGPVDANGFLEVGVPALATGQLVRASDGTTTKELTVVPLSVQGDTATDMVSATAPPNALVTLQAHCALASTSCSVTRLLAADGAGSVTTSLAPDVDVRGGSDLSASVADADGDRLYAKVGPASLDTDRDGIADLVDLEPTTVSAAFSDAPTGAIVGQVLSDGGLMVTVVDAVPPDGVVAAASGGAAGATAQLEACAPAFVVELTAGDRMTLTCSSLTAAVLSGPISIRASGSPAITSVPTDSTAKLTVLATGELQVQNIAGTAPIDVTVAGAPTQVAPGGSFLVAAVQVTPAPTATTPATGTTNGSEDDRRGMLLAVVVIVVVVVLIGVGVYVATQRRKQEP